MAIENMESSDLDAENLKKKGGGRIFSAAENDEDKKDLDAEIEKNIRIRTMPRKFKLSTGGSSGKQSNLVGAIIMIVGILVLGSAVYLAYIFLINPKSTPAPVVNNPVVSNPAPVVTPPVITTPTPTPVATTTPLAVATTTPIVSPVATTTPIIASSTAPIVATSTAPATASSTPAVSVGSSASILTTGALPSGSVVADDDKDGLSNAEEAIFGTDPNKADTDGDSYLDGAEVLNLYDPASAGKITANPHIAVYQDPAAKFSVDYPKIWTTQNLNSGQSIIFTAADNSFIEMIAMPDTGKMSIKDWYNSMFPDTPAADADVISKNGWQGIFHQSRETFYLADAAKNNIYTISYTSVSANQPDYYHIFLLMINSFTLK
jgi:hypothetical protein